MAKQKLILANNQSAFSNHLKSKKAEMFKERNSGDDTYQIWHNRIQNAITWRANHWNGDKNWTRAYDLYKGKHWEDQDDIIVDMVKSDNRRQKITVNMTGSSIQNLVPFLLNRQPMFVMNPNRPDSIIQAKLQSAILNHEYKQRKVHKQLKRAVLDTVIIGHGIVKSGYILEIDEAVRKIDGDIEYRDYIREEAPYAKRISPYNFVIDPTATEHDIASARWVAEIIFMPYRDLMTNSNHLKATIDKIKAGDYTVNLKKDIMNPDAGVGFDGEEEYEHVEDEIAICFEVWDKKYKKYYLFADGVLPPLVEKEWPYPYLDGFPYHFIEFIPVPDCHYPMGLALAIEDQQLELNAVRTRMFQHGRRFNRKYEVPEDLPEPELEKLADGEDGTIIRTRRPGSIVPIADAAMSTDHQLIEGLIQNDIRQITGADALIQGGALPSRTTAGEVNARGNIFRMKLDDRVESVDEAVVGVGEQLMQHIKGNTLTDKIVKIAGPEGEFWVQYTAEDIQDDCYVTIESVAAPKTDPQIMRQQNIQTFQIILSSMQAIQALQIPINWVELFKWAFENMEVRDAGRFFAPSLVPNKPLETQEGSNDLNYQQPQEQPNTKLQSAQDIQRQSNLAPLLNASGLQL